MNYKRLLPVKTLQPGQDEGLCPSMKTKQLKRLTNRNREMARLMAMGVDDEKIAKRFEISKKRLGQIRRSPLFIEELERHHSLRDAGVQRLQEKINDLGHAAVDTVAEIMYTSEDEKERRVSANSLLDRIQEAAKKNVNINIMVEHPVDLSTYLTDREKSQCIEVEGTVVG